MPALTASAPRSRGRKSLGGQERLEEGLCFCVSVAESSAVASASLDKPLMHLLLSEAQRGPGRRASTHC